MRIIQPPACKSTHAQAQTHHGHLLHPPRKPVFHRDLARAHLRTSSRFPPNMTLRLIIYRSTQFVLALLTLGPWLLLLAYDLLLYIWRSVTYEIPYFGGRARGKRRPRVPSLTDRSRGHVRNISLPKMFRSHDEQASETTGASRSDAVPMDHPARTAYISRHDD